MSTWLALRMLMSSSKTVSLFLSKKPSHSYCTWWQRQKKLFVQMLITYCYYWGFSPENFIQILYSFCQVFPVISVLTFITHRVSKVQHDEGAVGHARFAEVRVGLAGQVLVVQLPHPALIWTFGHLMITEKRAQHTFKRWDNKERRWKICIFHFRVNGPFKHGVQTEIESNERRRGRLTLHSSSSRSNRPSCASMRLMHCWLSLNSIRLQTSSSRMYSSCSKWNTCCRQNTK